MKMSKSRFLLASVGAICGVVGSPAYPADPIPIEAFARLPAIGGMSVSPDGRLLSLIQSEGDRSAALVIDLASNAPPKAVLGEDPDGKYRMTWCAWANNTRLVCGYRGMGNNGGAIYPVSRMAAVNADGNNIKTLIQFTQVGASQYQDRVLDWTPDEPDTVLIQADGDQSSFPEIYELNVYTGLLVRRFPERYPIRTFVADGKGNIRLGYGQDKLELTYLAKLANSSEWVKLEKFTAFSQEQRLSPLAVVPGQNTVYASGPYQGRDALWQVDLTDRDKPVLMFSHPQADADSPMLSPDGRLLGVFYETDRPFMFYTDELARSVIDSVKSAMPSGSFNYIADYSLDNNTFVIRSSSDLDDGTYYLFDRKSKKLERLGGRYPELDARRGELARMQTIRYKARDDVEIPGYLTVPAGKRAEQLPLIVMPHGGPVARDSFGFDWLVQFLANRGYAVLQMNFRGSSGYGAEWQHAAHQDWGGLTYNDIVDGAQWAVKQGIADPKRVCIVGWSFGGYSALLGATRNSDLFKCSASIAGVSDLIEWLDDARYFVNDAIAREQVGRNRDKLKTDSPRRNVEHVNVPVLLIHGDRDYQVRVEQSEIIASALKRAKKKYKFVLVKNATHQMDRQSDRVTLLKELEAFLKENL